MCSAELRCMNPSHLSVTQASGAKRCTPSSPRWRSASPWWATRPRSPWCSCWCRTAPRPSPWTCRCSTAATSSSARRSANKQTWVTHALTHACIYINADISCCARPRWVTVQVINLSARFPHYLVFLEHLSIKSFNLIRYLNSLSSVRCVETASVKQWKVGGGSASDQTKIAVFSSFSKPTFECFWFNSLMCSLTIWSHAGTENHDTRSNTFNQRKKKLFIKIQN